MIYGTHCSALWSTGLFLFAYVSFTIQLFSVAFCLIVPAIILYSAYFRRQTDMNEIVIEVDDRI